MELEKRVADIETDLKVVKGELKELLVDIRDLINKSENPFYNNHKNRISSPETKENHKENKNQTIDFEKEKTDINKSEIILENGLKDEKKDTNIFPEPFTTSYRAPSYEVQEQKMSRQNNTRSETQVTEPENQVRKIDTVTLVELMRWVDYAIRTIGHSNLESLLELYSLTGKLPEETKYVIKNIANISIEEPACEGRISMKDNIVVLSQLNAILNPEEFKNGIQSLYEDSGSRDDTKEKHSLPSIKCTN
jgi:archaellum component FlaD/FlaE